MYLQKLPKQNISRKPVETHEGEVRSFYTGEWMDEKKAKNRPVAVMTEKHTRNPSTVWNRKCGYYL